MSTYGIDLGTTYSCIATLDRNGNPEVIRNQTDMSDTLASAVFFETENNVVIGESAKLSAETDGDRVVQFVKRYIGKSDAPTYSFFGKDYTPTEISALILGRLKGIVEEQGLDPVDEVVITVPAYFGFEECNATRKAGELAGLKVLNLINEPTAAALSYCARQFQEERTIMVYDLGGGTFDVTVLKMSMVMGEDGNESQKVQVVATGGNDRLGGKDWDDKLFDHIMQTCADENGLDVSDIDLESRQLIRSCVEKTKKRLSNSESAKVNVQVNGMSTKFAVTREEFEGMTADLVAKTLSYVDSVLSGIGNPDLDTVLLVGGSTYMPMIRNAIEARFPGKVQIHEPDRAVAMGAAIFAGMSVVVVPKDSEGSNNGGTNHDDDPDNGGSNGDGGVLGTKPIVVVDVLRRTFGPGVLDDTGEYIVDNLLFINSEMPVSESRVYYTPADNMEKIILRAFESFSHEPHITPCVDRFGEPQESNAADNVKLLGNLELNLPVGTPKGSQIEVTFNVIDNLGITISAKNLSTGEIVEAYLKMDNDKTDVENSNVHDLSISGE